MKNYKAVIFDMDGTLIDSMWVWEKINDVYLGQYNIPVPNDMDSVLEGKSFTETAQYFKERFCVPQTIEEIKDSWNQIAWDFYTQQVPLKEGVREFLDLLKDKGVKLGIATSNSTTLARAVLEQLGIDHCFHTIRTSCEVEKGKPFPYIYLKVAEDLQVKPEECLVFEDVPNGVKAGKNAGMDVWAVEDLYNQSSRDELNGLADRYIKNFHEAVEVFK